MSLKQKKTLREEKRIVNSQWELDYFIIETPAHNDESNIKSSC